uniref:Defensin-like protein n=1 Tax=Strongyloides papillosus TaxID=174720 RepID=A0A0N5C4G7_STREA
MKTIYIIFFLSFFIACGSYGSNSVVFEGVTIVGRCDRLKCEGKCMKELKLGICNHYIIKDNPRTRKLECLCKKVTLEELFNPSTQIPGGI